MNHSTQVREFVITSKGIELLPIYLSGEGVLTGSSKLEHTLKVEEEHKLQEIKLKNEKNEIERKRKIMEKNIAMLKVKFESDAAALNHTKVETYLKENGKKMDKSDVKIHF